MSDRFYGTFRDEERGVTPLCSVREPAFEESLYFPALLLKCKEGRYAPLLVSLHRDCSVFWVTLYCGRVRRSVIAGIK